MRGAEVLWHRESTSPIFLFRGHWGVGERCRGTVPAPCAWSAGVCPATGFPVGAGSLGWFQEAPGARLPRPLATPVCRLPVLGTVPSSEGTTNDPAHLLHWPRPTSYSSPRCQVCLLHRLVRLLLSTALGGWGWLWLGHHIESHHLLRRPRPTGYSSPRLVGVPPSPVGSATLVHGTLWQLVMGGVPIPVCWECVFVPLGGVLFRPCHFPLCCLMEGAPPLWVS